MDIIVIHESGIDTFKTWKEVNKFTSFEKSDFAQIGNDFVLNTSNESYEIAKDIKLLERVASDKVFAKQKMSGMDFLTLGTFILVLYSLL